MTASDECVALTLSLRLVTLAIIANYSARTQSNAVTACVVGGRK